MDLFNIKRVEELERELAVAKRELEATKEEIDGFIDYVKDNGGMEYARKIMVEYRNKALDLLPPNTSLTLREALAAYIDYVIERDN